MLKNIIYYIILTHVAFAYSISQVNTLYCIIGILLLQDAFVLLDLIGAKNPRFLNFFPKQTDKLFKRLQSIGKLSFWERNKYLSPVLINICLSLTPKEELH